MAGPAWISDGSPIADPNGHGERAVRFLRLLRHPASRAPMQAVQLDPWQERIVRRIYGPVNEHGARLTRVVFLQVGRGNRKTSLGALLSLLHTFGPERYPNGQVISAAADRKQARIAFEEALAIVSATPKLKGAAHPQDFKNRLSHPKSRAVYEAISADAATQFGRTPRFALVDELWAHKKVDLWQAIRTGLAKTPGSLLVITTTAGRGEHSPDYAIYDYAKKVASGEIEDPGFLPIIFEAPADADWRDEAVWHSVNPGLAHGYPDIDSLRQLAREAEHRPADQDAFRQLHLGQRLQSSSAPFVAMGTFDAGAGPPVDLEDLRDRPCWLGVDLSSNTDLSVIVAAWPDDDGGYTLVPFFFCPAMNLQERQDRTGAPYVQWAKDGMITATDGNVVDFRAVEDKVRDLCAEHDVREIAVDPALARNLLSNLAEDGLPAVEHRQGALTMMPCLAELERAIVGRKLRHGGHPVLRFCFANAEAERNRAGHLVRLVKPKRWMSIDGAVAAAMAVGRASQGDRGLSALDDPNFDPRSLAMDWR